MPNNSFAKFNKNLYNINIKMRDNSHSRIFSFNCHG